MPAVLYVPDALGDLERLRSFLAESDQVAADETILLITEAAKILESHPLIGRTARKGFRELVISRGRTGYVALYRYDERHDQVVIAAIRHQREAGYESGRR